MDRSYQKRPGGSDFQELTIGYQSAPISASDSPNSLEIAGIVSNQDGANVLVRYIMQDDPKQAASAARLIESLSVDAPGSIPFICVVELAWVLSFAYDLDKAQITASLEGLLRTKELVVERAETVWKAVPIFQSSNAEFADY